MLYNKLEIKPTLHSHTHCQVAPANTQAKTWQRVCLPKPKTRKKIENVLETINIIRTKWTDFLLDHFCYWDMCKRKKGS